MGMQSTSDRDPLSTSVTFLEARLPNALKGMASEAGLLTREYLQTYISDVHDEQRLAQGIQNCANKYLQSSVSSQVKDQSSPTRKSSR